MPRVSKLNRQAALSPEDAERAAMELYDKEEARKVRKRPDKTAVLNPDENRSYIEHAKELMLLAPVSFDDAAQVKDRLFEYLNLCAESGRKPSVAGLALAYGIDRRRLTDMHAGRKQIPRDSQEWINKAYALVNLSMEQYLQDGKINPISAIFLLKANHGYQDTQRLEISGAAITDATETPEELWQKYADAIPADYDIPDDPED